MRWDTQQLPDRRLNQSYVGRPKAVACSFWPPGVLPPQLRQEHHTTLPEGLGHQTSQNSAPPPWPRRSFTKSNR